MINNLLGQLKQKHCVSLLQCKIMIKDDFNGFSVIRDFTTRAEIYGPVSMQKCWILTCSRARLSYESSGAESNTSFELV